MPPTIDRTACPGHGKHGTAAAAQNRGCRCPDAREAHRLMRKRRRHGRQPQARIPAHGTSRRLRALAAIGWSSTALAQHLRCGADHVTWLRTADHHGRTVHRHSAARVAALYDRLSGTPGPSASARIRAARAEWAPPLAWDDIDDPTAAPAPTQPRGRGAIARVDLADVDHLADYGIPILAIAARLGVQPDSINQARRRASAA